MLGRWVELFGEIEMDAIMDLIFLALIVGFFGASVWLVHFCASLMGKKGTPS